MLENIFGKQKPQRRPRKPASTKDKLTREANKELLNLFHHSDSGLKRSIISQVTGYKLPEPDEDPEREIVRQALESDPKYAERVKEAYLQSFSGNGEYGGEGEGGIESIIDQSAVQAIEQDPSLIKNAIQSRIAELTGSAPKGGMKEMFEQLEQYEALQERMGGKGGGVGKTLSELATAFAPMLGSLVQQMQQPGGVLQQQGQQQQQGQTQPQKQRTYIVLDEDGNPNEVSESEARRLLAAKKKREQIGSGQQTQGQDQEIRMSVPDESERQVKQEPESEQGQRQDQDQQEQEPAQEQTQEQEQEQEQEESSKGSGYVVSGDQESEEEQPTGSFSIETWIEYLDKEPSELIDALVVLQIQGDESAGEVLNLLQSYDADQILNMLGAFKGNSEYAEHIQQLEDKQEWLQEAIDYYRNSVLGDGE